MQMIDLTTMLDNMVLMEAPAELVEAFSGIDLNQYGPIFDPPQEVLDRWTKLREMRNPFTCRVERKIGDTCYVIDTECNGTERLANKVKRLIFSDKEAV